MRTTRRSLLALTVALGLVTAACADDGGPTAQESDRTRSDEEDADTSDRDIDLESSIDDQNDDEGEPGGGGGGRFLRLAPFADCSAFLDHVKAEAGDRVGPYGLDPSGYPGGPFTAFEVDDMTATAEESASAEASAPAGTTAPASLDAGRATNISTESTLAAGGDDAGGGTEANVTGTNTQEQGVDEPDIIKADGDRIITISENVLTYVDITGDVPVIAGRLSIPEGWGHQLFVNGDRAVLLTNTGMWAAPMPVDIAVDAPVDTAPVETAPPETTPEVTPETTPDSTPDTEPSTVPVDAEQSFAAPDTAPPTSPPPSDVTSEPVTGDLMPTFYGERPAATVIEVDLSDPAHLTISATLRIEGQYLNARAVGDRMLLAVSTGPQWMPWLFPQSPAAEDRARQANQQLVEESTLADWVPEYELTVGDSSTTGELLGCEQIDHPADFSGFDVISVMGIDLSDGLASGFENATGEGVLASGQTVYASLDRFYVATSRWMAPDLAARELGVWTDDYTTDLHAFAITPGTPVEYVASGSVPGTLLNSFSLDEHEGYLRVLATDGTPWDQSNVSETRLTVFDENGDRLEPVGEVGGLGRGEALYSARLIGDRGFAVTFRQVDPFYVLDLSDPTSPQVTGELKIPGFSTYLHPVGDHRVLGVGRAATEDGVVTGLKLSLFDVADPANPVEISTWTLDDAQSAAEYDYHAFQMIGSTAILPVMTYTDAFSGAIVFEIGDTIEERGRISHSAPTDEPTSDCRQLVEGDVPETSPAYWMSIDTYSHTQLCDAGEAGGFGNWYCDAITIEEFPNWFGVPDDVVEQLISANGGDFERVEVCYPPDMYGTAIQRSVIVDDTLWTMSPAALQANDLATLDLIGSVELR